MKDIKILIILIFIAIVGCKDNNHSVLDEFDKTIKLSKAEILNLPDSVVMSPSWLLPYDSLLLLKDDYDGQYLSLINVKTNKLVKRFLNRGQGPKEITQFGAIYKGVTKHEFIVLDIVKSKLLFFNIDSMLSNNNFEYYKSIQLEKEKAVTTFMTASFVTDDKIVGTGINDKGRYMLTDTAGKMLFKGLEYPYSEENINLVLKGMGYQASLTSNIHNNKFATTTLHGEILEIGQYNNNKLKIISRLGNRMPKYHKNGQFVFARSSIVGFCGLTSDSKYLYILHSGKNFKEHGYSLRDCNKLLVVDWNGKPIVLCKMQEELRYIATDNNGKYLYGIEFNPEARIIRHKIKDYLQ